MAKKRVISGDVRARGMDSALSAPIWMDQVLEAPAIESRRQAHGASNRGIAAAGNRSGHAFLSGRRERAGRT